MNNKPDAVIFILGQTVYMKVKPDSQGMVTGIMFRMNGISVWVTWAHDMTERWHADGELTSEKAFVSPDA